MSSNKMAKRIQHLLSLAEHPGTPEAERLLAAERAAELMEKYAIDELMARGTAAREKDVIIRRTFSHKSIHWQAFKERVISLARACDMKAFYFQPSDPGKILVHVVVCGFESDFEKFEALVASMELQAAEAWKVYQKSFTYWSELTANQKFTTRRSYLIGYGRGFSDRVAAGRQHAAETASAATPGTALVLVDRKAQVDAYDVGTLKSAREMKVNSAYREGRAAGRTARTGETEVGYRQGIDS